MRFYLTLILLLVCSYSFSCSNGGYINSIEDVSIDFIAYTPLNKIERARFDDLLSGIHEYKNRLKINDAIFLDFKGYVYNNVGSHINNTTLSIKGNTIIIRGGAIYFPNTKEIIALLQFVKDNKEWVKNNLIEYQYYNQEDGVIVREMLLPRYTANFITHNLRKFVTYKYAEPKIICQMKNFKLYSDLTKYYFKSGENDIELDSDFSKYLFLNQKDFFIFGQHKSFFYIENDSLIAKGQIPYYRGHYLKENNDSVIVFEGQHCRSSDSLWFDKRKKKLYFQMNERNKNEFRTQIFRKSNLSLLMKMTLLDSLENGISMDGFFELTK